MRFPILTLVCISALSFAQTRDNQRDGLLEEMTASNHALLVTAANGLPGIDLDMNMAEKLVTDSSYQYRVDKLEGDDTTQENLKAAVTKTAAKVNGKGSFLFYYSGHGSDGSIYLSDGNNFLIKDMKDSIEASLTNAPLERLVIFLDSCHSGSWLDPMKRLKPDLIPDVMKEAMITAKLVDSIYQQFTTREAAKLWKKLFVFASSKADENSMASEAGSDFTVGFTKAFPEVVESKGSVNDFIELTKKYTARHHPVARLAPESWGNERLKN